MLVPRLLDPALAGVWHAAAALPDRPGPADVDRLLRAAVAIAPGTDRDVVRALIEQTLLRRQATRKLGPVADQLLLTRTGLEQASRPVVAGRRARRLALRGAAAFTDLGCGIGVDSLAAARLGLAVEAIERDRDTAEVAAANLRAFPGARVLVADATMTEAPPGSVAFVDPGRRVGNRIDGAARRSFDPEQWRPPWSWVLALAVSHAETVAKAAPGLPHSLVPDGAEAEWVSVAGDLVEVTIWFPGLADEPGGRAAVLLTPGFDPWLPAAEHRLTGPAVQAPDGPLGGWLLEPDSAVVRSRLLAALCHDVDGHLVSTGIAYVTTGEAPRTPFARAWPIEDVLPADPRALRAVLRARGVGAVEIRTRGLALDPQRFRRELRLGRGDRTVHLALTRIQGRPAALLLGESSAPSSGHQPS